MKILIAEDDFTSRMMLHAILTQWGFEVVITRDGNEAFDAFQQPEAPRLGLLDWEMPKMDGLTLCRKLREHQGCDPLYLILLTAKSDSREIVQGLEAGSDDFISKPYENAELHARIRVGCRVIAMQNEMREREKLQGVLEMAGAVCHELNQPLQSACGFLELLQMDLKTTDPGYKKVQSIMVSVKRLGELTRKIMRITSYRAKPYLETRIIDIEQACRD